MLAVLENILCVFDQQNFSLNLFQFQENVDEPAEEASGESLEELMKKMQGL